MKKTLMAAAVVALIASPAMSQDGIKDKLDELNEKFTEALEGSELERFFETVFYLTELGKVYEDLCDQLDGEWDPSVPECTIEK